MTGSQGIFLQEKSDEMRPPDESNIVLNVLRPLPDHHDLDHDRGIWLS